MLQHHRSELTILRAVLAGLRLELAAIRFGLALKARRARGLPIDAESAAGLSVLTGSTGKYNPHHDDRGRFTTAEGAASGDGETDAERDSNSTTDSNRPIRLAQVGGAETMVPIGDRTPPGQGSDLVAPAGQQIYRFTVSPLTNNTWVVRIAGVDVQVSVTGWTAFYGPPGTRLEQQNPGSGLQNETFEGGVLRFVHPSGRRIHTFPVIPQI